jgi:hypothetical protein
MVRGIVTAISVATFLLASGVVSGQEERPTHEHGPAGEHGHMVEGAHGHGSEEGAMAEEYPPNQQQSFLIWLINSLGWRYTLLLPVSALASFVLTAVLVIAGKGRTTGAAMAFVVAIPFLIGLFGTFEGLMASFMVLAHSSSSPKPSAIAEGIGTSMVTLPVAMFLMIPSYLLATVGLFIRSLQRDPK